MDVASLTRHFETEKASAILRADHQNTAARAMDAAVRGGFRIIEFTLSTPGAFELIEEFSNRGNLVVGAGTVLDTEQARRAVDAGAQYLVSPVLNLDVISAARDMGVASMPGTHTATEMYQAHQAGATFCKLFPAPANGPAYVKSMLAPLPFLKIIPTNGVDHHNAGAWLDAGAFGLGFVATLFEPTFLSESRWDDIEQRARECVAASQST